MDYPRVSITNKNGVIQGYMDLHEALDAYKIRAVVRVFLFNTEGELLLQKRGPEVIVPNRWDHSAGGHIDEGQTPEQAAYAELSEELGCKDIPLTFRDERYFEESYGDFSARSYDYIFTGAISRDATITTNEEVAEVRWITLEQLKQEVRENPDDFMQSLQEIQDVEKVFIRAGFGG